MRGDGQEKRRNTTLKEENLPGLCCHGQSGDARRRTASRPGPVQPWGKNKKNLARASHALFGLGILEGPICFVQPFKGKTEGISNRNGGKTTDARAYFVSRPHPQVYIETLHIRRRTGVMRRWRGGNPPKRERQKKVRLTDGLGALLVRVCMGLLLVSDRLGKGIKKS